MLKLRITLLYKWPYYLLLTISFLICFIRLFYISEKKSIYQEGSVQLILKVMSYNIDGNQLTITMKGQEQFGGSYYFQSLEEKELFQKQIEPGSKLKIDGNLTKIKKDTFFHLFSYEKYAQRQNQFFQIEITNYQKIEDPSFLNKLKNKLKSKGNNNLKVNAYLQAFLFGNTDYINQDVLTSYRENGIGHLFAISGMHISFLSKGLLNFFQKIRIKEKARYIMTIIFLCFYLFLAGGSPSILRAILFFLLQTINKVYYFHIPSLSLFYLSTAIIISYQPIFLYDIGFQYSFWISFCLLLFSSWINQKTSYFISLLKVSLVSFLGSIPITIYHFSQINILGILYNLLFVPFVSMIIFPMSWVTFIIPGISFVYVILLQILEKLSLFFSQIPIGKIILIKPVFWITIIELIVFILIQYKKNIFIFGYGIILFCHVSYPNLVNQDYLVMLDVGQGDSILLRINNKTILVDTGGKLEYKTEKWKEKRKKYHLTEHTTIPYLKSLGISKIDSLILTHGDYDHMGEAINLVENFKVKKVIFNCGKFNELEQDLIKVLEKKKIPYYSCIKELNLDDNKLYFLNNKDYENENDNSSVIYTEINNHKFLFMGDAGIEVEKDIIEKYNLQDIDVLKVGHHGSKTSSSKEFIDEINPKYSLISVGKNNRYGHPNDSVLDNLEYSKIYRTDQDGSVMFKNKDNKLKIEMCPP